MRITQRNLLIKTIVLFLLLTQSMPASAVEEICQSCHEDDALEGNVVCTEWMDHGHPVNVVPPPQYNIPKIFPLDEEGKITCGTCHRLLDSQPGKSSRSRIYSNRLSLIANNTNSDLCMQCHFRESTVQLLEQEGRRFGRIVEAEKTEVTPETSAAYGVKLGYNHPVNIYSTRIPKKINELGGTTGLKKNQVICETCHVMHAAKGDKLLIHENTNSELCSICHPNAAARNRREAAIKGTHPVNIYPSAAGVSEGILRQGGRLGKRGNIVCITCHGVHGASVADNLLIIESRNSKLCLECHPRENLFIKDTKHDLNVMAPEERNIRGETISEGGICSACHLVHNGTGAKMWSRPIVEGQDAITGLCLSCHSDSNIAEGKKVGAYSHSVGVPVSHEGDYYTSLPLFTNSGNRIGKGNITCSTCHNVHRWDPLSLKKGTDDEGNFLNSFLRIRNIRTTLCDECHSKKVSIFGTSHDPSLQIYRKANVPKIVVPGRGGGICGKCHVPHNAISALLWNRELGSGEDDISRICSSCHSDGMVAQKHQIGNISHPVNISIVALGSDVPTPLPLRNEEYKKDPRGRVFCDSCHNAHQWDPRRPGAGDGQIVEGNMDTSYLRISARKRNNSLCDACHDAKKYIKGTDHDLAVTAPREKNIFGRDQSDSGICGTCHGVHNAQTQFRLWNKPLGEGMDMVSQMCNSCHAEGRCGQTKVLTGVSHPTGIAANMHDLTEELYRVILPIYDEGYKIVSKTDRFLSSYYNLDNSPLKITPPLPEVKKAYVAKKEVNKISSIFSFLEQRYLDFIKDFGGKKKEFYDIKPEEMIEKERQVEKQDREILEKAKQPQTGKRDTTVRKKSWASLEREKFEKLLADKLFTDSYAVIDKILEEKPMAAVYCSTCHDVHKWDPNKNIYGTGVNVEGDGQNSFLRVSNFFGYKLCVTCHSGAEQVEGTDHDLAITAPSEKNSIGQAAASSGVCGTCHLVHYAAEEGSLWARKLGPGEDYISQLCSSCHAEGGCAEDKQPGKHSHRIGVDLSQADGTTTLPLYSKEGKVVRKEDDVEGQVYCATCHNVHDWDPRTIGSGAKIPQEGDQNTSFLRLANLNEPALCIDCHERKKFVKATPHDLSYKKRRKSTKSDNVPNGGVCGPCHQVHNASYQNNLWARKLGPTVLPGWDANDQLEKNESMQYCTTCHNNRVAKNFLVRGLHLPDMMFIAKEPVNYLDKPTFPYFDYIYGEKKIKLGIAEIRHGARSRYPLFLPNGQESADGNITCPTCHDVHQWNPKNPDIKYSYAKQSNLSNSFLRADTAQRFCSDCHAYDSLYKFALFHKPAKTVTTARTANKKNPHWKGPGSGTGKCRSCHKKVKSATDKHPVNIRLPKAEDGFRKPKRLPLKRGVITCLTCHDAKIQTAVATSERAKNPNFLRLAKKVSGGDNYQGPPGGIPGIGGGKVASSGSGGSAGPGGNFSALSLAAGAGGASRSRNTKIGEGTTNIIRNTNYPICYQCHLIEEFAPFNPHINQITEDGEINKDMCLVCHSEVPNRWLLDKENYKLRLDIARYCVDCHPGKTKAHPGDQDHFGFAVVGTYWSTLEITSKKNQSYLPLKNEQQIVCSTCHNPHQTKVVMDISAQTGGDEPARLRVSGKNLCTTCHMESRAPKLRLTPF